RRPPRILPWSKAPAARRGLGHGARPPAIRIAVSPCPRGVAPPEPLPGRGRRLPGVGRAPPDGERGRCAVDVRASAYWVQGKSPESPPDPVAGQGELIWVDRVVAAIPCTAAHRVAIERLQPHPAALESWEVGPVRATARIGSDRETVEVVFHGSISV